MRLDVGNKFANEKVAVAFAAVGGVDVEAALSFRGDDQEIGDLPVLAQVFDQAPATAFEQSLFIIAKSMQKIERGIAPWRAARRRSVVAGWQHDAVVDSLAEDTTFQCIAINASLRVGFAEQQRNNKQSKPSQATAHEISLLVTQCLHRVKARSSCCRVKPREQTDNDRKSDRAKNQPQRHRPDLRRRKMPALEINI